MIFYYYKLMGMSLVFSIYLAKGSKEISENNSAVLDYDAKPQDSENNPVIQSSLGYLKGSWLCSPSGKYYAAFKGIPYAKPPLKELRFEHPQPAEPWSGVREALTHGSQCPQRLWILDITLGQEDCLYLNVYTPGLTDHKENATNATRKLLPIIFFIHGGTWTIGSGDMDDYLYGPDFFMEEDVILVTINYRLGALGFLSLGNVIPGNMGLKDQAMALQWVWDNADVLGGDKNRIIAMGQSAGGASAQYHSLQLHSRSLISGVIAQSGSILTPWAFTKPGIQAERTRNLARAVGCLNGGSQAIINCLKNVDPFDIVKYQFSTDHDIKQLPIGVTFTPTIEPAGTVNSFIKMGPKTLLTKYVSSKIPFLTGYTTAEGLLFLEIIVAMINPLAREAVLKRLGKEKEVFQHDQQLGSKRINISVDENNTRIESAKTLENRILKHRLIEIAHRILGDYEFKMPILLGSKFHAMSGASVYLYQFAFTGKNNFLRLFRDDTKDATHMDELTYQFQGRGIFGSLPQLNNHTSTEYYLSKAIIWMWCNFARTGNPTPRGSPIQWPANSRKILIFDNPDSLIVEDAPVMNNWFSLIDT
ncbi:esterase E4 [Cephus cinctus]|uniref:Carboxylesterase 8 n=1 Tax=Cephus cinctus TaxID=211228 RepID=A0A1W6L189_CEPCN|nr:esterase E4 [Cephus cinctus]ARN17875.1 carboxylesterase 8 [Cephus cinctus]